MKLINFKCGKNYQLNAKGNFDVESFSDDEGILMGEVFIDLSGKYDFTGFSYDVQKRVLVFDWIVQDANKDEAAQPAKVRLKFDGVVEFTAEPRSMEVPFTEDTGLEFIYTSDVKGEEKQERAEWQDDAENNMFLMDFRSGFSVQIQAVSAEAVTE